MRLSAVRTLGIAFVLALVVTASACGGGRGGAAGGGPPETAGLIPADAALFVAADTDFESEQWQTAEALLQRFPQGAEALARLDEVRDGLGPEVGVAVLDLSDEQDQPVVLVTKPADAAKLEAALTASEDKPVWEVVDGWYVVADDQATLARAVGPGDKLGSSETFGRVFDELDGDALARLYLRGAALAESIGQSAQADGVQDFLGGLTGVGTSAAVGVSLAAEPQGVRVEGVVVGDEVPEAQAFSPSLAALVPQDALAYVSFRDARKTLEPFLDVVSSQTPDFDAQLGQLQLVLGVSLTDDLLPLFEGEHALFVRAGLPIPEVTLLLTPADPQRALATLDKLTEGIPALAQLAGGDAPFGVSSTTVAGVPVKQIDLTAPEVSLFYARVGDHIVVSTATKGIADVVAPAGSIGAAPLYQEAAEAASVPNETTGLAYVNLRDAAALLETLGVAAGTTVPEGIQPLQYLVVYGEAGDPQRFTGFVGIK